MPDKPLARPSSDIAQPASSLDRALDLVRFLRANCEWDAAQTPESLIRYLLEEAGETADAIRAGDDAHVAAELGDLLLNVAFQIVIAEERGVFTADDVVRRLESKMRRRHPHLYGDGPRTSWDEAKRSEAERENGGRRPGNGSVEGAPERPFDGPDDGPLEGTRDDSLEGLREGNLEATRDDSPEGVGEGTLEATRDDSPEGVREGTLEATRDDSPEGGREDRFEGAREGPLEGAASVLDDVAVALPPLTRAHAIQARVAELGFDWPDASGALEKVREEVAEVAELLTATERHRDRIEDEIGDLFFAAVNLARLTDIDAAVALRRANAKFSGRFRELEREARQRGVVLGEAPLEELDRIWNDVKKGRSG